MPKKRKRERDIHRRITSQIVAGNANDRKESIAQHIASPVSSSSPQHHSPLSSGQIRRFQHVAFVCISKSPPPLPSTDYPSIVWVSTIILFFLLGLPSSRLLGDKCVPHTKLIPLIAHLPTETKHLPPQSMSLVIAIAA